MSIILKIIPGVKVKGSGIYITDNVIRLGQAITNRDGQTTIKEHEIHIASLKKEEVSLTLKTFLKENKIVPEYLVLGIPRTQVSIKYLNFPTSNDTEMKQMVEYELNNLFPYKSEELVVDHALIQREPNGYSRLMLVAAKRDIILEQILNLKPAGLVPDAVGISTVSLFNQFCAQDRPPASYLLINLDNASMEMLLISAQKLMFSRGVSIEGIGKEKDFIKAVELTATILKDKGHLIDKIILSGSGTNLEDFARELKEALPYEVEIDKQLSIIKGLTLKNNGNALNINLLPGEIKIRKRKAIRKKALFYFGALLLLNLSLVANIVFLKIKTREEYLSLLKSEIKKIEAPASGLQKKLLNMQMLEGYLNSGRLTLGLLSEVYRSSPEGISLGTLDIATQKTPRTMVISGQARDSETVLKFANALKDSAFIKKADVNYISKRKSAAPEQMVDFEIKAYF